MYAQIQIHTYVQYIRIVVSDILNICSSFVRSDKKEIVCDKNICKTQQTPTMSYLFEWMDDDPVADPNEEEEEEEITMPK